MFIEKLASFTCIHAGVHSPFPAQNGRYLKMQPHISEKAVYPRHSPDMHAPRRRSPTPLRARVKGKVKRLSQDGLEAGFYSSRAMIQNMMLKSIIGQS